MWSGGDNLSEEIRAAFRDRFSPPLVGTYGLTEAPTVVAIEGRGEPHQTGCSGRVLPHLDVREDSAVFVTDRKKLVLVRGRANVYPAEVERVTTNPFGMIFLGLGLAEFAGDDHALDLVGALEDLRHLGLAHVALDGEVAGVARAAEHLHGVGGHPHRHVGGD